MLVGEKFGVISDVKASLILMKGKGFRRLASYAGREGKEKLRVQVSRGLMAEQPMNLVAQQHSGLRQAGTRDCQTPSPQPGVKDKRGQRTGNKK